MATVIETKEQDGRMVRVYDNGAVQDVQTGYWVAPAKTGMITADNARDMLRLREQKRHRLYALGAQRAVQDVQLLEEFGEDAHMVERAMTLQVIATTPDAGKAAVMADTALQRAQGYDVKPTDGTDPPPPTSEAGAEAARILARVLSDVINQVTIAVNLHDTIEGEIRDE